MTKSKKTWLFHWNEGGYNTVLATGRQEALRKARMMAGGLGRVKLTLNEGSLTCDSTYIRSVEERYRGILD
jgi:hypothetical protein